MTRWGTWHRNHRLAGCQLCNYWLWFHILDHPVILCRRCNLWVAG